MERAYDQAKYGEFSRRPYIDMVIPTLTDPSVAPPGKHVLSCFVQYAPYQLRDGHLGRAARGVRRHGRSTRSPSTRRTSSDIILHRQVLTPLDLEREFGLTEGNIFQGELTLEQLFFLRPAPGWARYRRRSRDLWMCGSATHPGGGIMGAPGRNAARRILGDERESEFRSQEVRSSEVGSQRSRRDADGSRRSVSKISSMWQKSHALVCGCTR